MVFSSPECNFPVYSPLENKRRFCCLFLVIKVVHIRIRSVLSVTPHPPTDDQCLHFVAFPSRYFPYMAGWACTWHAFLETEHIHVLSGYLLFFHFMYHSHSFVLININPSILLNGCIVFHWIDALWFNQYTIVKQLSPSFLPFFFLVKQNFKHHDNFIFVSFLVIYLGYISRYEIYWITESAHFNDKLKYIINLFLTFFQFSFMIASLFLELHLALLLTFDPMLLTWPSWKFTYNWAATLAVWDIQGSPRGRKWPLQFTEKGWYDLFKQKIFKVVSLQYCIYTSKYGKWNGFIRSLSFHIRVKVKWGQEDGEWTHGCCSHGPHYVVKF